MTPPRTSSRLRADVRPWIAGASLCLAALVLVAAFGGPRWVVVCDAFLDEAPEPTGWRTWPLLDPHEITGRHTCPGTGTPPSLARAFDAHGPAERWVRQDGASGVVVIADAPRVDEEPRERFVAAFHRRPVTRLAFASKGGAACAVIVGLAIASLGIGLVAALRPLRRVRGRRMGADEMEDGTYRDPPSRRAMEVLATAQDARAAEEAGRAVRAIRSALLAVLALFGAAVFVVAYLVVRGLLRVAL